jgi:hypothetical protein
MLPVMVWGEAGAAAGACAAARPGTDKAAATERARMDLRIEISLKLEIRIAVSQLASPVPPTFPDMNQQLG